MMSMGVRGIEIRVRREGGREGIYIFGRKKLMADLSSASFCFPTLPHSTHTLTWHSSSPVRDHRFRSSALSLDLLTRLTAIRGQDACILPMYSADYDMVYDDIYDWLH